MKSAIKELIEAIEELIPEDTEVMEVPEECAPRCEFDDVDATREVSEEFLIELDKAVARY